METSVSRARWCFGVAAVLAAGFWTGSGALAEEPTPGVAPGTAPAGETVGDTVAADDLSLGSLPRLEAGGAGTGSDLDFPVTAGWDRETGFFLSDRNKQSFLLNVGGYIQPRYELKLRDPRGDTGTTAAERGRDQSFFEVERGRVDLSGYVIDSNLTYRLLIGGSTDDQGDVGLLDAFVLYKFGEYFGDNQDLLAVGAGQFKPYFLRQEATEATRLQFVDRSLANEFFNIGRNIGVWLQGDMHWLFWSFAVTNGIESVNRSSLDVDQIPAFIGKLDFNLLGHEGGRYEESNVRCDDRVSWVVGLSGMTDQNNDSSSSGAGQTFDTVGFGIDTVFRYNVFSLQAEYMGRFLDYGADWAAALGTDTNTHYAHGFYLQGGVFLIPGSLEVAARTSAVWSTGGGFDGNAVEVGPAINWYISKSHNVKLQTDLMFFDISGGLPLQTGLLYTDAPGGVLPADFFPFYSAAANYQAGEQGAMWRVQLQLEF